MPSLYTKHTHKCKMNMNTGLNQLASLYNKDEEAKKQTMHTTINNSNITMYGKERRNVCASHYIADQVTYGAALICAVLDINIGPLFHCYLSYHSFFQGVVVHQSMARILKMKSLMIWNIQVRNGWHRVKRNPIHHITHSHILHKHAHAHM